MKTLRGYRVAIYAEGHIEPIGGFLSFEHVSFVEARPVTVEVEEHALPARDRRGQRCIVVAGRAFSLEEALLTGNARLKTRPATSKGGANASE